MLHFKFNIGDGDQNSKEFIECVGTLKFIKKKHNIDSNSKAY